MLESFEYINSKIKSADSILLSTHENPDCDGLGSEIALYYHIKSLGKDCRIINCTEMHSKYKFIDPDNIVEVYDESCKKWLKCIDLAIIFDIGNHNRLRDISSLIEDCSNKINVDHHISRDSSFFSFELVDASAPATGSIVWDFLDYIKSEVLLDIKVANALYSSIITDTGSFRYSNTDSKTHIIASSLLKIGVDTNEIYQNIYENRTKSQIALLSHVIENVEYAINNEVAYVTLFEKDFSQCNATLSENDGMSDFLRSIEGVEISFVITEIDKNMFKVSFRSRKKYIINDIAEKFGGGGHALASGATVKTLDPDKLADDILFHLEKRIKNGN